jgi:hypothetical protein
MQNQKVRGAVTGNRWLRWAGQVDFCATSCATRKVSLPPNILELAQGQLRDGTAKGNLDGN